MPRVFCFHAKVRENTAPRVISEEEVPEKPDLEDRCTCLGITVHCEGVREIPEPRAECEMLGSTLGLPISAGRSNLEAIVPLLW